MLSFIFRFSYFSVKKMVRTHSTLVSTPSLSTPLRHYKTTIDFIEGRIVHASAQFYCFIVCNTLKDNNIVKVGHTFKF